MHAPGEPPATRIAAGQGTALTLADGRVVVDGGSMSACILGHGHPEVVAAIERGARLPFLNDHNWIDVRERAAEDLVAGAFGEEPWAEMVAFFVSSSEAADLALLLAQMVTGRSPLVSREVSYHGAVGLARDVSTHPGWGAHLAAVAGGGIVESPRYATVRRLPVPSCGVGPVGADHRCSERCLADAAQALDGAAAVIMDHTQGGVSPSAQYQDALARLAREAGALWIADETVTAFGRSGHALGFQRGAERPSMVTLGKGMTAGSLPGGALVLSREVVEEIGDRRWLTSSTFRGNPIVAAVVSAVQHVIARDGLVQRSRELGAKLGADVAAVAERHPSVRSVVGEGMVWILRLAVPPELREDAYRGDGEGGGASPTMVAHRAALDAGAFVGVQGSECLWVIPPLVIGEQELARVVEALDAGLTAADAAIAG